MICWIVLANDEVIIKKSFKSKYKQLLESEENYFRKREFMVYFVIKNE